MSHAIEQITRQPASLETEGARAVAVQRFVSRHVRQKHKYGCGPACLAMISGIEYDEIVQDLGGGFDENYGITCEDAVAWLTDHGYATSRRWKYKRGNIAREPWPGEPWADLHLVQVQITGGTHFILWFASGTVLDPNRGGQCRMAEYKEINQIAGIHPFGQ